MKNLPILLQKDSRDMRFGEIIGHEDINKVLRSMADSGRVPHAMLFYENEGCGGLALALAFIQYLNCPARHGGDSCGECPSCARMAKLIHPDVHFVYPVTGGAKADSSSRPTSDTYASHWRGLVLKNPYFLENDLWKALGIEGKSGNIAVAEAKSILEKLSFSAVENGYKTILMWLPEKMNAEAANRLLKIVEEPPANTIFLFITHAPEKVLQTIFSRCQSLRIPPQPKEEAALAIRRYSDAGEEEASIEAGLCGGSIGRALADLSGKESETEFLDIFSDFMRAALARDLMSALETGEMMSGLDSREKQKAFCNFAGDCVRKIFMLQQDMPQIAWISPQEKEFFTGAARNAGPGFCRKALGYLDKAAALLDRNVNAKIVFCDLVNRLFLSI